MNHHFLSLCCIYVNNSWKVVVGFNKHIIGLSHFPNQTPAPTRTASFSESCAPNDVTPAKKSRAGVPGGNYYDTPLHSFFLAGLHVDSYSFLFHFSHPCIPHVCLPLLKMLPLLSVPTYISIYWSSCSLFFFFLALTPSCFLFVFLRLSRFYTVASEEYGHRKWER